MSKINRHPVRRTAAGVLAGALAFSGLVATAVPANAAAGFELNRLAGDDRFETSALAVAAFGPASGAILAAGENGRSADALAASFLAGVRGVPVALTTKNRVTAEVLTALNGLGGKNVTIVGGVEAVSEAVVTQLRAAGYTVDRVSGANRYETAREIVEEGESAAASNIGIVASGTTTIDALAGGPLAYAGKHPVLLVTRDGVPGATLRAIQASGVTSVFVLGGEAAVGPRVVEQLRTAGVTVRERLAGDNRSETSVAIANRLIADFGFSASTFNLASGLNEGVDALSAAALSGKERRVLLLTQNANTAPAVTGFASANAARLNAAGRVFGGTSAVSAAFETSVETAGGAAAANQTFTVAPAGSATLALAVAEDGSTAANADNRQYTVTTPAAGATHTIQLVPAANVIVAANGAVTFRDADGTAGAGDNVADFPAAADVAARISEVNGVQVATASQGITATAVPVAGTITFTIDGVATGSVVPVVYFDAGTAGLQLDANNAPTAAEPFGVGGATTYTNPAAESQAVTAGTSISSVNKGANQFDALNRTFTYDTNDTFRISGLPVTQAEFVAALSAGDTLTATYTANAALSSTFDLVDAAPGTGPTPVVTVGSDANSNDVTVTVTVTGDVDAVQIQRATVTGGTPGAFTTIATEPATDDVAGTNGTQVVYVDNNLAAGTYQYRVVLVNDGDTGAAGTAVSVTATTPTAADTTAPTIADARVGTNGGSAFLLESGDSFLLAFSEPVAAPTAGDTFRLTDGDGTIVDVLAGGATRNAGDVVINGTTYGANRVLTVTRSTSDVFVASGTQSDLGLPATITQQSGTTDAAGNQVNVAGSADAVVDTEAGTVTTPTPPATLAQATSSSVDDSQSSATENITINFDQTVTAATSSLECDDLGNGTFANEPGNSAQTDADTVTFDPTASLVVGDTCVITWSATTAAGANSATFTFTVV